MSRKITIKPSDDIISQLGLKNLILKEIKYSERHKIMSVHCVLNSFDDFSEVESLEDRLKISFQGLAILVKVEFKFEEIKIEDIKKVVERAIKKLQEINAVARSFLHLYRVFVEADKIKIEIHDAISKETLEKASVNITLTKLVKNYGLNQFDMEFVIGDFSKRKEEINTQKEHDIIKLRKKLEEEQVENAKNFKRPEVSSSSPRVKENVQKFQYKNKGLNGTAISIDEFYNLHENEICVVEGEVFFSEIRNIREGTILATIKITDKKNSVTLKSFVNDGKVPEVKEGEFIRGVGKKSLDRYANNEEVIMMTAIEKIDKVKEIKKDLADKKMVELHVHTKMSEMVGVDDISDIINRAVSYGHSAIAVTDYSVVHSFPFAYKAAKGKDIKVLLGCEMYMVDDTQPMVRDSKDKLIEEEIFVVFDLETTGLNSHKNEIIEIGAVKLKGTRIIDRFSEFVKPAGMLPDKITELTGITDRMIENAKNIEDVLPRFMDFAGDATFVAHNSAFDMSFIRRDCEKILSKKISNPVIDTLQMARDLFPNQKAFGLEKMTKFLGVELDSHHRAVDDSQATANIFIIFLGKYLENGITNLKDIDGGFPINIQKQETKNVIIFAKNNEGLKNLYKLVSEAHITHFGSKRARILKSSIEKNRAGLLIGSSLSAHHGNDGELAENYFDYDFEVLEKNIDFYDYIELLPCSAYSELIDADGTGRVKDFEQIKTMNKYFYDLGKQKNKLVTASSNIHHLEQEDFKIRSILLYGSGTVYRKHQFNTDNGFYFRTTAELLKEFDYFGADVADEIVVQNTNKISDMIEKLQPVPDGFYPPKIDNAENIVSEMTYEKAYRIYGEPLPEIVEKRIERELKSIIGNGFAVLYLSAQKLVKKSLDNGYLVGSRGSVGSSLVAYMMDITEVNALHPHYLCESCKHSEFIEREGAGVDLSEKDCPKCGAKLKRDGHCIPFEVFMGFDGEKVPDIDLNFSGEYQSEIHRYCEELFGKENVFKAGTISTLAEKNAYGFVMKYCEDNDVKISPAEMLRIAKKCEGAKRTTGQHPGGMIVIPQEKSIYDFCPVQKPANDMQNDSITTHFDYHVMDEQLVKLDILGHDDPTTIKLLSEYTGIDIYSVPLADEKTLKLFSSTESLGVTPEQIGGSIVGTYGIPEFGTGFVRQMLVDTMPTTFAELVRISGLSHGTDVWLNNAQEYVRQKLATLPEIISVRDDIMNYLIDQGLDKSTAFKIMEFVRKGQPSKKPEEWKKYSDLMKEHKVKDWYIESCGKIKYMFPKGHAVAYVMMAMRIAYFKVHHPIAFYAAYFTRKNEDFNFEIMFDTKIALERMKGLNKEMKLDVKQKAELALCEIVIEMNARGLEFLPIDIYKSDGFRFLIEDNKIRIPLIALAGLGGAVAENIIKEKDLGKFTSYEDFKRRTKASQTIIDKLKNFGAIESLSNTNQISMF
ncbi:MAG: PolC-type DNA polymerase III [Fusobacteriaceae bacterium]